MVQKGIVKPRELLLNLDNVDEAKMAYTLSICNQIELSVNRHSRDTEADSDDLEQSPNL